MMKFCVVVSFFELQKHHLDFKHKTPPLFHHKVIRRYTLVESFITPKTNQPPSGPLGHGSSMRSGQDKRDVSNGGHAFQ